MADEEIGAEARTADQEIQAAIESLREEVTQAVHATHLIEIELAPLEDRARQIWQVRASLIRALEILAKVPHTPVDR